VLRARDRARGRKRFAYAVALDFELRPVAQLGSDLLYAARFLRHDREYLCRKRNRFRRIDNPSAIVNER
jgi:hypothetical protein